MEGLTETLNKLSTEDIEKLKVLFSVMPGQSQNEVVTLRVFCEEYLDLIKNNRSENYYTSVELALRHLTDHFGKQRPIGSIAFKDVELFVNKRRRKAPKGYRVYFRTLKAAFGKAVAWNYVTENHFYKVKLPKVQKVNPSFITVDQLNKICDKIEVQYVKDFGTVAFYTGMRLNELVNMKWNSIDFKKRLITVGDKDFGTKGYNQRYIPIRNEVYSVLIRKYNQIAEKSDRAEDLESESPKIYRLVKGYVFCKGNGGKYTGDHFSRRFKKACRKAGIDESIHFHSLRHSFASGLAQRGVSLYVIKELLGHCSVSTTEIYSHLNVASLEEAINKFNEGVDKLADHKEEAADIIKLVREGT